MPSQIQNKEELIQGSINWRFTMAGISRILTLAVAVTTLVLFGSGRATAQGVIVSPARVSYYYPAPTVTYYSAPVVYSPPVARVSYYYAPAVTYYQPSVAYYAPTVSYSAPAVSYYAAPAAVTTTRYGLFGRPRVSTTYVYP
jgi:hypothetical protein